MTGPKELEAYDVLEAEESTEGEREPDAGPGLDPSLLDALERLDPDERKLVGEMVRRARRKRGSGAPLTGVGIINALLESDPEYDDFSVLQNIAVYTAPPVVKRYSGCKRVELPSDLLPLEFPLREVLAKRASRRDFSKGPLSLDELASLLTYSYGIRKRKLSYNVKEFPFRFVPSTGGLQPIEVYLTVNAVEGLEQGLYHFDPDGRCLEVLECGNFRRKVVQSCVFQDWLDAASVVLFLTCDMRKVEWKYGRRAYRFVHVDIGILSQTLHLVATALRLRSCMVAGYLDRAVHDLLQIDGRDEFIGLLLAVGRKPWEPSPPEGEAAPGA